ncbi:hypothetical protein J6590_044724 [Homalodisca vitripennis]|nr:hypothetical protein J6590_044724 [Homalodisca vitripennis]
MKAPTSSVSLWQQWAVLARPRATPRFGISCLMTQPPPPTIGWVRRGPPRYKHSNRRSLLPQSRTLIMHPLNYFKLSVAGVIERQTTTPPRAVWSASAKARHRGRGGRSGSRGSRQVAELSSTADYNCSEQLVAPRPRHGGLDFIVARPNQIRVAGLMSPLWRSECTLYAFTKCR